MPLDASLTPEPKANALAYANSNELLVDHADRFALLLERLQMIRDALPDTAALSAQRRRELLATIAAPLAEIGTRLDIFDERMRQKLAATARLGTCLPLIQLQRNLGLSPLDMEIIGVAATLDRGMAFNQYRAGSNREPLTPDVAFFSALLADDLHHKSEDIRLRFTPDAPLVDVGVITLTTPPGWSNDAPLVYQRARLADRILDFIEGAVAPPPSVLGRSGKFFLTPPSGDELFLDDALLVGSVARAMDDPAQLAIINGSRGVGRRSVVMAAAQLLKRPLLLIDLSELPLDGAELLLTLEPLLREALIQGAVLLLAEANHFANGEGQAALWPLLTKRLHHLKLPLAIIGDRAPQWLGHLGRLPVEFNIGFPVPETQRRLWIRHLPPTLQLAEGLTVEALVKRYSLSPGSIKEAAEELVRLDKIHNRGGRLQENELTDVVRRLLAHRLGSLAQVVRTTLDWKDLILPNETLDRVFEFLNYAMQRERVMTEWGFRRKLPYGRGLSALFSGPPGTGKTMICSLLANELGVEMYRIDLSQVVNKYIGETEKNLGRVFDEAAHGQVMLLFDEADSIFAKRTEVKSSHDRYANLEVNYLLQRMENFDGIVVLTTNSEASIDPAFRRRIRFRLRFPAPDEQHRQMLWRAMIPQEAQQSEDIDFAYLAKKYPMAGGSIMNAVVRAAIAAAAGGTTISNRHLVSSAELEYAEMGFLS